MELEILYQDDYIVAINKPNGLLVHRSKIAAREDVFALQLLRDQLGGAHIFPVHRLDRKTSGVLVFAKDPESARALQQQFEAHNLQKRYLALVRGYFPETVEMDRALTNDRQKTQEALTHFRCLERYELPIPLGNHASSRYSLVEALPKTGRMHQIRKHCNHLRHPIIGDRPHGCNKQNKLFLDKWGLSHMLLHAQSLEIEHPQSNKLLKIEAALPSEFERILAIVKSNSIS